MTRRAPFVSTLLVAMACGKEQPTTQPPEPATAVATAEPAAAEPEDAEGPAEVAALDVPALAAGEAIVFLRAGDLCEAWQFVDGGARLERTDDESLGLVLSFAVAVRGSDALTLTEPRATSRGEAMALECPDGEARDDVFFAEEADCEAGERAATVKAGCPDALLSTDQRVAALHRLEAERAAISRAKVDAAPATLKRFRKMLAKKKAVYWREDDGTCERWAVSKGRLVHKTEGGRMSYGLSSTIDRRTGLARVDLTGPDFDADSGDAGSMGVGDFQQHILSEVTDDYAVVGPRRWFFTEAACKR